jgi:hypothetical protein
MAEREAAGSHRQGTGTVSTTALAHRWTPLGAKHIRRAFQDVCESTRLGRDRAPRDLRHVRLAVVCQWEAVEKIARLAGRPAVYLGRRRPTAVI